MPITVLNVAEKPSVAREVARILNGGTQPHSHMPPGCALLLFHARLKTRCSRGAAAAALRNAALRQPYSRRGAPR